MHTIVLFLGCILLCKVLADQEEGYIPLSPEVLKKFCLVMAFSSNHFDSAIHHLVTAQQTYPCKNVYIYNLGLRRTEVEALVAFPFVHMLQLNMTGPYFPNEACAFKPIMIRDFIRRFHSADLAGRHDCRYFFYGDASVYHHRPFDQTALDELHRLGMVAQKPLKQHQLAFTHPKMFPFFGFNRTLMYEETHLFAQKHKKVLKQVQAGLMLVDAANATLRDTFIEEWAACAENYACLIPDNIVIPKASKFKVSAMYPIEEYNVKVFKAHRDDQSAFTFLIAKYFGYSPSQRQVFLYRYTWFNYRQRSTVERLRGVHLNNSCPLLP